MAAFKNRIGGLYGTPIHPVDQRAIERGCYMDESAGLRVKEFIERFCYITKGKPMTLLEWQWFDVVLPIFGWKRADGTRRFRTGLIFTPKKNGKSALLAALGLYGLVADGEDDPQVYNAAYDREQAAIIYRRAADMVDHSPELSKLLRTIDSTKRIITKRGTPITDRRCMKALSKEVAQQDGADASLVIADEIHRWKTDDMWKVLQYAGSARTQPLKVAITTAGDNKQSLAGRLYDYAKKIDGGIMEDDSFFSMIYEAGEKDDWEDPKTWARANPAYGEVLNISQFEDDYKAAKGMPSEERNFKRLRLNLWIDATDDPWIDPAKWSLCKGPYEFAQLQEELEGCECWAGLDMSQRLDLTALVLVFPREVDGKTHYSVLPYFWCPREGAILRERRDRVPYLTWSDQGFIECTAGDVIDVDAIFDKLADLRERYVISQIAFDPRFMLGHDTKLADDGFEVYEFRQTPGHYSPSVDFTENAILTGALEHGNHPVLSWCVRNTVMIEDDKGAKMPSKRRSRERIDGATAMIMACGGVIAGQRGAGGAIDFEPFVV